LIKSAERRDEKGERGKGSIVESNKVKGKQAKRQKGKKEKERKVDQKRNNMSVPLHVTQREAKDKREKRNEKNTYGKPS